MYFRYSFTLRAKDKTIAIVIINTKQEMGWNVDDVMPKRDGLENLRILKKSQLKVDFGPSRHIVEFLP